MWLGPAPEAPYSPARTHVNFRWVLDYSGGQVTDWGGHHPDIAQWGMDTEYTGPVKIQNARAKWSEHPVWNTAVEYYFECVYKNGVKLIISSEEDIMGVKFEGSEGSVWATRGNMGASFGGYLLQSDWRKGKAFIQKRQPLPQLHRLCVFPERDHCSSRNRSSIHQLGTLGQYCHAP